MKYKTEQENFWHGGFGSKYIKRNIDYNRILTIGKDLLENKVMIKSVIELGSNMGLNLDALKKIYPNLKTFGIEINKDAFKVLKKNTNQSTKVLLNSIQKKNLIWS